ncbi:IS630 family transposase [Sulfitobacter sp.]|uniref:IS630 family transposase n=1 Tax=Sulfitobacter sp. TaxID=1903071 RepID=UPI003EF13B5A
MLEWKMPRSKKSRRLHTAEFKAAIVIAGLGNTCTVTELCKRNRIPVSSYYNWRKRFILAGTNALTRTEQSQSKPVPSDSAVKLKNLELFALEARFLNSRKALNTFPNRMSEAEKLLVIQLVRSSKISDRATLKRIGVPRSSYYRWVRKLRETGTLKTCVRTSDYRSITQREDVKELVFQVLHAPPSDFGFNRTTWKLNELQEAIKQSGMQVGRHSIRRIVKEAGYRWLKARKVLTSNDPDYRQKLSDIQKILRVLGEKEGFFSIDEYGPFAVKQRQGKKLVPPGETFTVPQFQKSKGALIMTAALELSSNQVTHFYSKKKNTEEMIKLLELLRVKYHHLDRIFLSWDAASWHVSKKLIENIEQENSRPKNSRGPTVVLAPLPAGAQFLNVIEAVFSGMSRAIIHNSNYATKGEAKAAIDRYFHDRNQYFLEHPKRAGNKIWGKEPSSTEFSDSNNCKDPRYR